MKAKTRNWLNLPAFILLSTAAVLIAQAQQKATPTFSLAIEEVQLSTSAGYTANDHELIVRYTNITDTIQKDNCAVTPTAYKIVVLRDGLPVEQIKPKDDDTGQSTALQDTCHGINRGIDPGKTAKFTLWVSPDYDMTVPGTYEITVTRETDPWNLAKSVTVKSNTLTIVVPEPGADTPK
jgi:hypothetical protein